MHFRKTCSPCVKTVLLHRMCVCFNWFLLSQWVSLLSGLQTPILHLNNSTPYESEEFKVTCSAPEEKGRLAFNFYKTFRDGQPTWIKRLPSTSNFLETTLTLRHIGDCFLSCDYEIILVTGTSRSNSSNEIQVKVKGDYIKYQICAGGWP